MLFHDTDNDSPGRDSGNYQVAKPVFMFSILLQNLQHFLNHYNILSFKKDIQLFLCALYHLVFEICREGRWEALNENPKPYYCTWFSPPIYCSQNIPPNYLKEVVKEAWPDGLQHHPQSSCTANTDVWYLMLLHTLLTLCPESHTPDT